MAAPARLPPTERSRPAPAEGPPPAATHGRLALLAGSGAVLLWAAFPPLDLPWLAWVAPWPWLHLVQRPTLPARRTALWLWLAGSAHWLLMLEGIRRAHPALYAGWLALAVYLGLYLPLFVLLTRAAVQRWRMPLWLAAPVTWVGLELWRGHLLTGFSMGLLAHTQAEFPWLIQVADLAGGYGVSFLIMLTSAATFPLAERLVAWWARGSAERKHAPRRQPRTPPQADAVSSPLWPGLGTAGLVGIACLAYGQWRLAQVPPGRTGPALQVALIQGALDTVFEITPQRLAETIQHYHDLTVQAVQRQPQLDLIVWPESAFVFGETVLDPALLQAARKDPAEVLQVERLKAIQADFAARLAFELQTIHAVAADAGNGQSGNMPAATSPQPEARMPSPPPRTWLAVGTTTHVHGPQGMQSYNTALLADPAGHVRGRYAKMHLVMFGEYIPLGERLPWLYRLTPLTSGLAAGDRPTLFEVAGLRLAPSICFESTVPHLIRRQVAQLQRAGRPVDLLLNFTNDGWFWGSAMLDLHFRCGIFRAVELRKPLLVAANTGLSAVIDGNGVVQQRGPRRQPALLLASVPADGRTAPYLMGGDGLAGCCGAACVLWGLGILGPIVYRRRGRPPPSHADPIGYSEKRGTKSPAPASNPVDSGPASAPG